MRIENSITMRDNMSGTLNSIIRTMNTMTINMRVMDQEAAMLGNGAFGMMNQQIIEAEIQISRLRENLISTDAAQQDAAKSTNLWTKGLGRVSGIVSFIKTGIQSLAGLMPFVGDYINQGLEPIRETLNNWAAGMADSGALKELNNLFLEINSWLTSSSGQAFLDGLAQGLYAIVYLAQLAFEAFQAVVTGIEALGPVADAVLYGALAGGIIFVAQSLFLMAQGAFVAGGAFLAGLGPVGWVIIGISAAIGAAVAALLYFGFTANDILTVVGGLFGGLAATVANIVFFIFNLFTTVAEFLANVLIDPVYAVKKLFYDLVEDVLGFLSGLVNGLIDGVNFLSKMINKVAGTELRQIDNWTPKNPITKPEKPEGKGLYDFSKMDYLNYNTSAQKGSNLLTGFVQKKDPFGGNEQVSDLLNKAGTEDYLGHTGLGGASKVLDSVGRVDKVGAIDGDVNIAQEDLKYLLDATTQKYVNEINLTVQTQAPVINNNGTVREEADIGKVAATLAEKVVEQSVIATENKMM